MSEIYDYLKIIHIFCAIIFLGYVFFDVVIFASLKGVLGDDFARVKQAIGSKAIKIMPVCLLTLIMTGGMMMSAWVGGKAGGYFSTPTQQVFMMKVFLALAIFFGVIYNLTNKAFDKQPPKFMREHFHKFVLVCGFFIVLFAKVMFMV